MFTSSMLLDLATNRARLAQVITQAYKTGQFVLESTRLSDSYAQILDGLRPDPEEDDDTEET